jgi:hypothetical protein
MAAIVDPFRLMVIAIGKARQTHPSYERESGTNWPYSAVDPAEARLFAFAALKALDDAGFEIVPKKAGANANRT